MSIFQQFSNDSGAIASLKQAFDHLCMAKAGAVVSLTIHQCNGAYGKFGKNGKNFSKADLDVKMNIELLLAFGSIFSEGVSVLSMYLDKPDIPPSDKTMCLILSILLKYLLDNDNDHEALKSITKTTSECELAVRFAEHFFAKLGTSPSYTLNKNYPNNVKECTCGCKKNVENFYGETSLGHPKVWHGYLDILLPGLSVAVIQDETEPPGNSTLEVNNCDLEDPDIISQIMAQNIVFSFLQKLKHPEYSNYLIPSIGVNKDRIIFSFYDSQLDVLLRSPSFPIFNENGEISKVFILASWFVLNYRFLSLGLDEEDAQKVKKSRFFELADCMLPIYEKEITVGSNMCSEGNTTNHYEPWFMYYSDLSVPKKRKMSESSEEC